MVLSIIIPVFNAIPYIRALLSSIESQDNEELEIILINDGSYDGSGEICMNAHFQNYHVINQQNEGLCSARNRGICEAKGEYLWFVDADDLLPAGIIDDIIYFLKGLEIKYDIINCNYVHMINDTTCWAANFEIDNLRLETSNSIERVNYLYGKIRYNWAVWNNLYRSQFIMDNGLLFDNNFFNYEDGEFNMNAELEAKNTIFFDKRIYKYRKDNVGSRTKYERSLKYFQSAHNFCVKWYTFFQASSDSYDNGAVIKRISECYRSLLRFIMILNKEDRREALNLFKQYSYIVY